ncbi:MAG: hypothetical protein COS89_02045 [Deltaproteobacteria bacterium CG07_land_8_20_14_0_80_38_7]|nr:MAG: hypothetical protein COS89_02045 [Deltaproteobacteria bacterium CG07_land_8_20_14_0_80_38_7]
MDDSKKPNIFQYDNYRKYLRDWFIWMKKTNPVFSYRAFSQWAGFKSPNQLLLVMDGKRNISISTLNKYLAVLKLKDNEAVYFELLVKFNQAKDMPTRTRCFQQLSPYWLKRGTVLGKEQYDYLSGWFYTAIREMVNLNNFKEDGRWISKRLKGMINPIQARRAIEILLKLNLLKRDENDKLVQTSSYLTTGNETEAVAAYIFHEHMLHLAMESLKKKPSSERNISSLTFTIRKKDYESIVSKINEFRKEVVSLLENRAVKEEDDSLYELSLHLFPIGEDMGKL